MQKLKSQSNKQRTVAIPQRLLNKVAISMIPMGKVERKGFYGYEGSVKLTEGTMTIRGVCNITAHDMRMFHFVLSQWQAMRSKTDDDILFVDLQKVLQALDQPSRTESRRRIIAHLQAMVNTTITFEYAGGAITFGTLDFVKVENANSISLRVARTFEESMVEAKQRYINIESVMTAKSNYVIELASLLQIDGSGVYGDGKAKPANAISHIRVCEYVLLEDTRSSLEIIRRAFKALEKQSYPRYTLQTIRNRKVWVQEKKYLSSKIIQNSLQ